MDLPIFRQSCQGKQLQFTIIPPDANRQPDQSKAQTFVMNARTGNHGGDTGLGAPPAPMVEQPPRGKTGGGIFGPLNKKPNLDGTNGG